MRINFEEKRSFPRIALKTPMRYHIRGSSLFHNAICDDISPVGIGFVNQEFLAPQGAVELEINILSKIIPAVGKIAWSIPLPHSNRYRIGVAFTDFQAQHKKQLLDYLEMQFTEKKEETIK